MLVDVPALEGGVIGAGLGGASMSSGSGAPRCSSPRMARVPLAELAEIRIRPGPSMISAENGLLRERVFLNVRGRDVGSFVDEAKRAVEERVSLAAGYFLEWSGQYEHQVRARNRLLVVVPACFAIIFVLLWMTYRSWKEAAHVILAIPFALTGGNLLLWALHVASAQLGWRTEFHWSVAVWVGYIALFGTAVQTAVVMVVYLEEALRAPGRGRRAHRRADSRGGDGGRRAAPAAEADDGVDGGDGAAPHHVVDRHRLRGGQADRHPGARRHALVAGARPAGDARHLVVAQGARAAAGSAPRRGRPGRSSTVVYPRWRADPHRS